MAMNDGTIEAEQEYLASRKVQTALEQERSERLRLNGMLATQQAKHEDLKQQLDECEESRSEFITRCRCYREAYNKQVGHIAQLIAFIEAHGLQAPEEQ